MTKFFTITILLLLITIWCSYGQPASPKDVNVLYTRLNKSNADTSRVNILLNISRYDNAASVKQPALLDSALIAASRAGQLAAKLSYAEGTGLSYQLQAQAWCQKKDFKKSDELIKKATDVFLAHNLFRDAAEAYLNMEEFYLSAGGKDYNIMIGYYEQAAPLFIKSGAKQRAGDTFNVLGDFYLQVNKHEKAIADLQTALTLYQSAGKKDLQSLYDLLGINYMLINNFKDALKYALLAVKTTEALQDTSMGACTIYNRTGMIYFVSYQYAQANIYYRKAMLIAQKYNDRSAIFLAANLASGLVRQNEPAEAIKILKENEKRFPSIDRNHQLFYKAIYVKAYLALKRYPEAGQYSNQLLKVYLTGQNENQIVANMLGAIIPYFTATRQYAQAAKYLPAFLIASKKSQGTQRFVLLAYLSAYQIDSAQHNDASAIVNYKKYTVLKDSISEATKNKQMQELQVQYETEKTEKENSFLRKESLLQTNKAKQADHIRNLTLTGTVLLLVFVVLLYYSYRVNQKNSRAIAEKNDSLKQLVAEKEWLLKEIHHRVKNNLQIVMGLLQRQSAYINNDEALAAIQNSENRMHSIALIHQKLYQSENLDLICMPEYISEMISYLKDSSGLDNRIVFEKQVDELYLDVAQAVPLGLILNEAITNAIKYAYAANETGIIYVSLISKMDRYNHLTIADDGPGLPVGFNVDKVESLGINLMRGLSKQLGGSFDITSEQGCIINISFKTEIFSKDIVKA